MPRQSLILSVFGAWILMMVLGLTKSYITFKRPCDGGRWSMFDLEQQIPIPEIVGAYIFCFLAEIFGRKYTIIALNLPIVLSCAIFEFSCHSKALTAANIIGKLSYGGAFTILPIYIGEISEKQTRGCLISLLYTSHVLGKNFQQGLFAHIFPDSCVSLINYGSIIICILTSIIFAANAVETPSYYIQQKKFILAREAIGKIRSPHVDIDHELDELLGKKGNEEHCDKLIMPCLGSTGCLKSSIIMLTLLAFQVLVGNFGNMTYYSSAINSTGYVGSLNILRGIVVCGSSILGSVIVDRIGRLSCLYITFSIILITESILLVLTSISKVEGDVDDFLLLALSLFYFSAYVIGPGPVPFIFRGELFPKKFKMILSATTTAVTLVLNFFIAIYIYSELGTNTLLFISVISALMAIVSVKLFYPETKGKSLNEIQSMLNRH